MQNLFNQTENAANLPEMPNAEVRYFPNFLNSREAQECYNQFYKGASWRQDDIKIFGKIHPQPRLTALYATHDLPYSYSSITMYPEAFSPALERLKTKVEHTCNYQFNSCLLNLYRNGRDSNGWHADDEKELGKNPVIASVSLGAARYFKFRNKKNKKDTRKILLQPGSLLLMEGATQHFWQHQLPKTAKDIAPRINLTFRNIKAI